MPTPLKQILDDKTQFADNLAVTLAGGQTVTLGDLRGLTQEQQTNVSKQEQAIRAREQKLQADLATLQKAQNETANLYKEVSEQRERQGRTNETKVDPLESMMADPVLGPLAKEIRAQAEVVEQIQSKQLRAIATSISQMAQAYMDDRVSDVYERTVPLDQRGQFTLESLLQASNEGKITTRTGIPDIARVYRERTTKPMTQAEIDLQIKAAREEGLKAGEEKAMGRIQVPRPTFNPTGGPREASEFKPKNLSSVSGALDEAFAAAAKDVDIWKGVDQLAN